MSFANLSAAHTAPPVRKRFIGPLALGRAALTNLAKLLAVAAVTCLAMYLISAMTLFRYMPTGTDLGFVAVRAVKTPTGITPPGTLVYASSNPDEVVRDGLFTKLVQTVWPQPRTYLGEVLAGPYGKVQVTDSGEILVDGQPVGGPANPDVYGRDYLEKDYLVRCIAGDCTPGVVLLAPHAAIYGQPVYPDRAVPSSS